MGMFDSVFFFCPHCGEEIEVQSKAGFCNLYQYKGRNACEIPATIVEDVEGGDVMCPQCERDFVITAKRDIVSLYLKEI